MAAPGHAVGEGGAASAGIKQSATQIRALLKKNIKIHLRTNALPCCNCSCSNGCVPISACLLHVLCPTLFVFITTAVPWLIVKGVANERDQKMFLDVQTEPPMIPKPWPGFPLAGDDAPYRQWEAGSWWYGLHAGEDYPTAPPFLTPVFEKKATKTQREWGDCEYYIESCHCQTLAIVGPSPVATAFKSFLEDQYDTWESAANATGGTGWSTAAGVWWGSLGVTGRRLQGGAAGASRRPSAGQFGALPESLEPLRERLRRLAPAGPEDIGLGPPSSKRRLQKRRGRGGEDDKEFDPNAEDICDRYDYGEEVHGDAITPLACDVDAGNEKPIFRIFGSAEDVDKWIDDEDYGVYHRDRSETSSLDRLCGAVVFENDALSVQEPAYTIRMNVTHERMDVSGDFTSFDIDDGSQGAFQLRWYYSGFLQLQHLVQRFIAEQRTPGAQQDAGGWDQMAAEPHFIFPPTAPEKSWGFGELVGFVLGNPIIMSAMFGPVVATIAFYMSRERNTRQRELMRMMGLSDGALISSWLIMFVTLNFLITFFMTILFTVFFFKDTSFIIVWTLLWFFANATMTLGMMVASLVSSDRMATMMAFALFFGLSFTMFGVKDYDSQATKSLWSLVPSNAFLLGMTHIWQMELRGVGATLDRGSDKINNYSVGIAIGMLFLDFWLLLGAYYYFDSTVPWHNVGVPRKPWFFFQPSYWREVMGRPIVISGDIGIPDKDLERQTSGSLIESEEDPHLKSMVENKKCVIIRNLNRRFRNASGHEILAVNNLSLTMYQDECFCLLGHNGAGKTTTMMMLTGCLPQTSGQIEVKGVRVPEGIRAIRSSMGFCPQHNVLIDELTVMEHLELFGTIGGMTWAQLEARGRELLAAVALSDKMNARSTALSGGMKRKLSCALAFLSEPYLVILDEPSSGMDPFARRGMWDTLKRWRTGHILCLTTHYMDEADALGDRIAIMGEGRLVCSGSSTFLKKKFGLGYIISFAKCNERATQDSEILHAIKGIINEVEVMSSVGKEFLVQVPFSAAEHFGTLFPLLDQKKQELGIESYGTSITNLEEVFLRVAKLELEEKKSSSKEDLEAVAFQEGKGETKIKQASFFLQVYALLLRRFRFGYRNWLTCCCQICMPMMCLLAFCALMLSSTVFALPSMVLAPTDWNVDVASGPKAPVTVGVAASLATAPFTQLWQGVDSVQAATLSVAATSWPFTMPLTGHDVLAGVAEEAGFVKAMDARKDAVEASQYGAIFYPDTSSWCPAQGAWLGQPAVQLCAAKPGPTVAGNVTSRHSPAIMYNIHAGAMMKGRPGSGVEKLQVSNHPFQKTWTQQKNEEWIAGIFVAIILMASYGFIPAGATSYVVMEKERDVKNQLIISGCSQLAYWVSNLIFDVLWGLIPCVGAQVIFHAFSQKAFITSPGLAASIALFLSFLPAAAGFAYLFGFLFSKAGVALFVSWIFYMMFGVLATTVVSIVEMLAQTMTGAMDVAVWLRWIFRCVPIYGLGYGHLLISVWNRFAKEAGVGALAGVGVGGIDCPARDEISEGETWNEHRYCIHMVGDEFLMLTVTAFVFFFATVAIDIVVGLPCCKKRFSRSIAPWLSRLQGNSLEDADVLAEKARVKGLDVSKQFVFVDDIHKVYNGKMHAVKGISFAAEEGQVFGLLGVNGAGKTTTFKMLCGQVEPSAGTVCIQGFDITTHAAEARRLIGYCPQFDALLDSLTTKEHLELYGHLKGLSGAELNQAVKQQLHDLDLNSYVYSRAGQLSGGNKRKTSVAMATIGEPPMVFLDEPSAGMDPVARRGMWSVIQNIAEKRKKSVVILTTHSMEEAEALCSRIAIQVDGQFRCLGTAQHIKAGYGQGLELNVRLATPTPTELLECVKKFGAAREGEVLDSVAVQGTIQRSFDDGAALLQELSGRPGSPLQSATVEVTLLAEWVLLAQRTRAFEVWLVQKLQEAAQSSGAMLHSLEKSQNVIRYQIMPAALTGKYRSLGELFNLLQQNKKQLQLEDYQVCQPSLEQIFNKFATTQLSQGGGQQQQPALAAAVTASTAQVAPEGCDVATMTRPLAGQEVSPFLVDNSKLNAKTPGLGYRTAKQLTALAASETFVGAPWGSEVQGVRTGDGWLQVGQWFLPLEVQGIEVIVPKAVETNGAPAAQVIGAVEAEDA